jgi:hypothetical protein
MYRLSRATARLGACSSMQWRIGAVQSFATERFLLADIGEGIAEVEVLQWYCEVGQEILMFDKVCFVLHG